MHALMARFFVLTLIAAGAAACGGDNDAITTPTPERTQITEAFDGRLTLNGAVTHPFLALGSGEIRATIVALGPDAEARIGLSLGTWNGSACQIVLANDNATQGTILLGNAVAAANFCVRVYDVGLLAGATDYSLTVIHY